MTLSSVVLPAPFGPITPNVSPWRTPNVTPSSAVSPPKRFVTDRTASSCSPAGRVRNPPASAPVAEYLDRPEPAVLELVESDRRRQLAGPAILAHASERGLRPSPHERRRDRRRRHCSKDRIRVDGIGVVDRFQREL